jgi:RNA polymerase sigma-70 factor (ECF subfamily)
VTNEPLNHLSGESEAKAADRDLMQRVSRAEEAAIAELYDRFGSLVYRMAAQSLPTKGEAEDAVQEIFVRLWRTADRYDARKSALVTWVMLITRRHIVDCLRRSRARVNTVSGEFEAAHSDPSGDRPGAALEMDDQFARLLERIESLPELQRIVVRRAYLGGQTLRQIADELDTPIGTVKSALSRALVRLRERSGSEDRRESSWRNAR